MNGSLELLNKLILVRIIFASERERPVAKKTTESVIEINAITMGRISCYLVGTAPGMLMHRFSLKARQELLFPKGRANAAEKAENLKHDPLMEFREAMYRNRNDNEPAAVHTPSGFFSKALASAALDLPGASKAQILRLVSVASPQINLFGIPRLHMEMVRSSDMARTPDVRTRPCFTEWCCKVNLSFVSSLLKQNQIVNLLAAAGEIVGIGDYRPQKGGAYGKFRIVDANDPDYLRIQQQGGRKAQLAAIEAPDFYDADSEELFAWFQQETVRREKFVPSAAVMAGGKKRNSHAAEAN